MKNLKNNFGKLKVSQSQKTKMVQSVFTEVTQKYDLMNNFMSFGTHHLWKKKIVDALGSTQTKRAKSTWNHYDNARIALKNNYWENSPSYNRETDPFFRKLITQLNNK